MRVTSHQVASFSVIGVSIRLRIEKVSLACACPLLHSDGITPLFQFDALLRLCVNKAKREVWSERVVSILEPRAHWQLQVSLWAEAKLTPVSIQLHLLGPMVSLPLSTPSTPTDPIHCFRPRAVSERRWARPTTSTSSRTSTEQWRRSRAG